MSIIPFPPPPLHHTHNLCATVAKILFLPILHCDLVTFVHWFNQMSWHCLSSFERGLKTKAQIVTGKVKHLSIPYIIEVLLLLFLEQYSTLSMNSVSDLHKCWSNNIICSSFFFLNDFSIGNLSRKLKEPHLLTRTEHFV